MPLSRDSGQSQNQIGQKKAVPCREDGLGKEIMRTASGKFKQASRWRENGSLTSNLYRIK